MQVGQMDFRDVLRHLLNVFKYFMWLIFCRSKCAVIMLGDGVLILPVLLVSLIISVAFVWNPCRFGGIWCILNYSVEWKSQDTKGKMVLPSSSWGKDYLLCLVLLSPLEEKGNWTSLMKQSVLEKLSNVSCRALKHS